MEFLFWIFIILIIVGSFIFSGSKKDKDKKDKGEKDDFDMFNPSKPEYWYMGPGSDNFR